MSKSIEMNYYNGSEYEILYPNTIDTQVIINQITGFNYQGTLNSFGEYLYNFITTSLSGFGNCKVYTGSIVISGDTVT